MGKNKLVNADYIREALGVSRATAYRIIKELNQELEAGGIRTLPGKVSLGYFEQRFFAVREGEEMNHVRPQG